MMLHMSPQGFAGEVAPATLQRARAGDAAALTTLYRQFSGSAYTLALRLTGARESAEDVVQEAFLKAMSKLPTFRGDAPFGAWLKRLVANSAIDFLRARKRLAEDGDHALALLEDGSTSASAAGEFEALGLLHRLPHTARVVLVLHALEGYSHSELARMLGRSESYSKSILSRALAVLRRELEEEERGQQRA